MSMDDTTKLTVNLVSKALAALTQAAALSGDTQTDVVNRALQVYAFVLHEQAEGQRLALVSQDSTVSWVLLL